MYVFSEYITVGGNIMELINKNCEHCGDLMINVVPKRMYCDKCRRERRNELKRRTRFKYTTEEYDKNFYTVTKNNKESLTTKGFNRLSSIKVKHIQIILKCNGLI